ncbi:MAG: hypothetical protein AB7I38_16125 [Dehalococcoidia bacterium]
MRRRVLLSLVVLTLVSACSSVLPWGQPTPRTYGTVAELAKALRTQQLDDATVLFGGKSGESPGSDVLNFSGGMNVTSAGTDMSIDMKDKRGSTLSVVIIDQDVFIRDPTGAWQRSPLRERLTDLVIEPIGLPVFGNLWLTQLDGSADAFSLSGSSTVLGSENTEYRLHADFREAADLALRHIGAPAPSNTGQTRLDLDLTLTLDPYDRLVAAHWTVSSDRETWTTDYTFTDWGSPVDITAPAA